ncbi:ABC transporter ATP-binding protein [uncultured Lactobacillus sp.]|uniref:ATP-binding cassette domain-containing protein n=1 Tax=uncultured Lactobacillus sp. TaxID=153152 RepID=UPI0026016D76|nr:ABC transporter ATP-binding protein [uncultured Lactobacillus sp.]
MLKKWIKTNPGRILALILFSVVLQIFSTTSYYLVNPMLNAIMDGEFQLFIIIIISKFVVDQIANGSLSYGTYLYEVQTQDFYHSLRQQNLKFYVKNPSNLSDMENDLTSNLDLLDENYFMQVFIAFNNFLYVVCVSLALLSYNWILVFYSFSVAIISLIVPKFFEKFSTKATNQIAKSNSKYLENLYQWIVALDEVRRYRIGNQLVRNTSDVGQKLEESEINQQKVITFSTFCQNLIELFGIFGIPVIAGILYFQNKVQFGTIVAAGYLANGIFSSLGEAISALTIARSTHEIRQELNKYFKTKSALPINKLKTIKIKNGKVKFSNNDVLSYNFELNYGDHVLVTGPSGSGKSTLLKIITGQQKLSSGTIKYFDFEDKPKKFNLSQLGYLPQENILFPGSILENITMFNDKLDAEAKKIVNDVQLTKDLSKFDKGIYTKIDPNNITLSGGQKQKIFLARALVHPTTFLLLDEALSAIDPKTSTLIIKRLLKEKTVLLVAHNLSPSQKKLFTKEIHLYEED